MIAPIRSERWQQILVGLLALIFLYSVWPYVPSLLFGGVLAVLCIPLRHTCLRMGISSLHAALLITGLVALLFLLPFSFLTYVGIRTAVDQAPVLVQQVNAHAVETLLHRPEVASFKSFLARRLAIDALRLQDYLLGGVRDIGQEMVKTLGFLLSEIPEAVLHLTIILLALMLFLHKGDRVMKILLFHSPLPPEKSLLLIHKFSAICRSLILASLVVGILQSFFFTVACALVGIGNLSFIGLGVFAMSFVPMVGSMPFTFGVALIQYVSDSWQSGLALAIMAVFVAVIDNIVRPALLKQGASIHPIIAILAILGGLRIFGFAGVFLGPLLAGMLLEAYRQVYGSETDPAQ